MATYAARLFYAVLKQDLLPVIPPYETRPDGFMTVLGQWTRPLEFLIEKEQEKAEGERRKKQEADMKAMQQQLQQRTAAGGGGGGAAAHGTKRTHDGAATQAPSRWAVRSDSQPSSDRGAVGDL